MATHECKGSGNIFQLYLLNRIECVRVVEILMFDERGCCHLGEGKSRVLEVRLGRSSVEVPMDQKVNMNFDVLLSFCF